MHFNIPPRSDSNVYTITPGLTLQWLHDGRVLVYTWTSISRQTVDIFSQVYMEILDTWPIKEPLYQLNDLRFEGFSFTPYLRNAVQQVIRESLKRGMTGRVANVMQPGLFMRGVQFFLRATALGPGVRAEIFANYVEAINWLDQEHKS